MKLKEIDDSGVPPQIVGGDAVNDAETFVIGDDDAEMEEEGFEYVHDVEMAPVISAPPSPSPAAASHDNGLRGSAHGSPHTHSSWDRGRPADLLAGPVE